MSVVRLLLADDHTLVLDGLHKLLEGEFKLVGTAKDGRDLLAAAEALQPDVILLDISMPLLNGLDAARQLRQRGCRAKLLFVTMHSGPDYVKEAFRAGASGYVLKNSAAVELVRAVQEVVRGNYYLSPLVSKETLTTLLEDRNGVGGRSDGGLTVRQREVLQLVAEGHSAKEIAGLLGISQKTVEFHKASIMRILGMHSTAELTRYAISHGLVVKD